MNQTQNTTKPTSLIRKIFLGKPFIIVLTIVIIYTLFGFFLAPYLIDRQLNRYVSQDLGRRLHIETVRLNPYALTLEISGAALSETDGSPLLSFQRFFADFELSSLFRWAWTFADIRIEQPSIYVEIRPDGRLNFALLADKLPQSEKPPETDRQPPRLFLEHIAVVDGSFTFSDRSDPMPATETFAPINFEFKEISTLPERKGPYTISAKLPGGGTVGWRGEVFLNPISSEGELSVAGFNLATAWKFIQDDVNLSEPSGRMDFSTRYRFDYLKHTPLMVFRNGKLALNSLVLTEKDRDTPILSLETVELLDMNFDLQAHELTIPDINVRNGQFSASVDKKGRINWEKLVIRRKSSDGSAPVSTISSPAAPLWRFKLEAVNIENIALDYTDRSRATPLALAVGELNLALKASAEVGGGPLNAILDGLKMKLNQVALSEASNNIPLMSLESLELEDGSVDIGSRMIAFKRIEAFGGGTSVVRDEKGQIRLLNLLNPGDQGLIKREVVKMGEKARTEGKPWSFKLNAFDLNSFSVSLKDRTFVPDIVYELKNISVSLENLSNDGKTPIDFNASLKVVEGGHALISGQVSQTGDHAKIQTKIIGINLKPLRPAVTRFTFLTLESGHVSASTRVNYRSAKAGLQLRVNGSLDLNGFRLNEVDTGERFLEWKELAVSGITFDMSPRRLQVDEMRLLEPGAKVMIFKDRSVNLVKILKRPDAEITGKKSPSAQSPTPAAMPKEKQTLFPVNVDRIRVNKGVVDFTDLSLVLPFAARITDFNGGITGISSEPTSRASVKFDGRVDEYGLATVEGRLSPFMPKTFTNISVLFRNVQMKPLSPYSATFAGRKIASGKLSLDLEYKIQNSELLGDNKVLLEQFTLGDQVKAPKAVHLPLDLAIALLTDSEGKINVAVPVRGNLDNPQFSYGHVIRQALINLITKIVTAPFRALGSLLGGKNEQLDAIAFNPGSSRLAPPEMEKLKKMAKALQKRPQLGLMVQGRFDPKLDAEAIRNQRVQRSLAEQMGMKLTSNEKPAPLSFHNVKTQKALEKLLKSQKGKKAVTDFKTQYEKTTGKKAKRANFAMALIGRGSSDTAFYEAMFKELVKLAPLTDADLQNLAHQRAQAIVKELHTKNGLDARRTLIGNTGPVEKTSAKAVNTKIKLEIVKPAA